MQNEAMLNYTIVMNDPPETIGSSVGSGGILLKCTLKMLALFAFVFGYRLKWVGGVALLQPHR